MSTFPTAVDTSASPLEALYSEHFRLIYETALHITANPFDADDVVQSIFLQLVEKDVPLESLRNPAGYFLRAATNQAVNIVAARKRIDLIANPADRFEALAAEQPAFSPDPGQQLLGFMAHLKPDAALMIKLRYIEGVSNKEIARMLGKSEAVVAMRLLRERKRLQKIAKGEL